MFYWLFRQLNFGIKKIAFLFFEILLTNIRESTSNNFLTEFKIIQTELICYVACKIKRIRLKIIVI